MIQAFKDELATGAPVLVVNPDHASPSLVEFLGRLPIDAVWIDCERGAADLETVANTIGPARSLNGIVLRFGWVRDPAPPVRQDRP